MLMTDDKLLDAMRAFVTTSNRLLHLSNQDHLDLRLHEEASALHREAARGLQEVLVQRGWRRPGY